MTLPVWFSHLGKTKMQQDMYHAILEIRSPIFKILEEARGKKLCGKRSERSEDPSP